MSAGSTVRKIRQMVSLRKLSLAFIVFSWPALVLGWCVRCACGLCSPGYELEDLKLANDEEMDHVEDLIALPHLHEAAILHSLCR